jgi:glycosyltransferase involved in cell wall biosynthesis
VTALPTRGRAEGLGLSLVEALLAGSAVVGSRVGGIPEVVQDGETGLLFGDGDVEGLAGALARLIQDHALRDRLSAEGLRRVKDRYAPDSAARRFLDLYDDIAGRRPSRPAAR